MAAKSKRRSPRRPVGMSRLGAPMATRPRKLGRYDKREIAARVNRERAVRIPPGETRALDVKEMADRIGISADDWYKRTGKRLTPFTVEELGRIADVLGAPPYWPFGDWETLAEIFGREK